MGRERDWIEAEEIALHDQSEVRLGGPKRSRKMKDGCQFVGKRCESHRTEISNTRAADAEGR